MGIIAKIVGLALKATGFLFQTTYRVGMFLMNTGISVAKYFAPVVKSTANMTVKAVKAGSGYATKAAANVSKHAGTLREHGSTALQGAKTQIRSVKEVFGPKAGPAAARLPESIQVVDDLAAGKKGTAESVLSKTDVVPGDEFAAAAEAQQVVAKAAQPKVAAAPKAPKNDLTS